jgi:integrase
MTTDLVPAPAPLPADYSISPRTRERIEASVPENTKRAYARWWGEFEDWCAAEGRASLPATAATFADYVSALCDRESKGRKLGAASIEQAIAVIQARHRAAGLRDELESDGARRVLKTHRRDLAEDGKRTKEATPITAEMLQEWVRKIPVEKTVRSKKTGRDERSTDVAGIRDRAVLVLGFAMFARRSELVALNIHDVTFTANGLEIYIRSSKTDQAAKGAVVQIPTGKRTTTNPVRVVRAWLDALASQRITEGRLLRAVDRNGNIRGSLSPDGINRIVRAAARRAELEDVHNFTAHSLRAGGATAAYAGGAPISVIAKHGRWSPNSPTPHKYVRAVDGWKDNALKGVDL